MNNKKEYFKKIYDKYFPFIFTSLFLLLVIVLVIKHEFWRDEVLAWEIANAADSLKEFVRNIRADYGHPYLWNFILYLFSHYISENIEIMKFINVGLSVTAVFLFLKYSPFKKILKILFISGYYVFYEYTIISRNYSLGILFAIIFCILYQKNKDKNLIFLSLALFLMGQSNLFAFFISISLLITLMIDLFKEKIVVKQKFNKISFTFSAIIFLTGIYFLFFQFNSMLFSNGNNSLLSGLITQPFKISEFLGKISVGLIKAYLPVFNINLHFWNNNFFAGILKEKNVVFTLIIGFLLFIIPIFILKRKYLIPYIAGSSGMFFLTVIYKCNERHFGNLFILFIILLWLSEQDKAAGHLIRCKNIVFTRFKFFMVLFLLVIPLAGSVTAFYYDYKYPFSEGKSVAEFLKSSFTKNELEENVVLSGYRWGSGTVSSYLDKDMYFSALGRFSRLAQFNEEEAKLVVSDREVFADASSLVINNDKKYTVVVIWSGWDVEETASLFNFHKIGDFDNAIVDSENLYAYIDDYSQEKIKSIFKIDQNNFDKCWENFGGCSYLKYNDGIKISVLNNDPNFESSFKINELGKEIIMTVELESASDGNAKIYFKRIGENYNEQDTKSFKIRKGYNNFPFFLNDTALLQNIRLDPIDTKSDLLIREINFYSLDE